LMLLKLGRSWGPPCQGEGYPFQDQLLPSHVYRSLKLPLCFCSLVWCSSKIRDSCPAAVALAVDVIFYGRAPDSRSWSKSPRPRTENLCLAAATWLSFGQSNVGSKVKLIRAGGIVSPTFAICNAGALGSFRQRRHFGKCQAHILLLFFQRLEVHRIITIRQTVTARLEPRGN
jgi:hypothetical protein